MLATVIDLLSLYWCISNQPVAGSIIVTHLLVRSFIPLLRIVYGPIKSIHILSHGLASASYGGSHPYSYFRFGSLASWACLNIGCYLVSHFGPKQVL
jgi:hypothetical protein